MRLQYDRRLREHVPVLLRCRLEPNKRLATLFVRDHDMGQNGAIDFVAQILDCPCLRYEIVLEASPDPADALLLQKEEIELSSGTHSHRDAILALSPSGKFPRAPNGSFGCVRLRG